MIWRNRNTVALAVVAAFLPTVFLACRGENSAVVAEISGGNFLVNGDFEQGESGWHVNWGWADVDAAMRYVGRDDAHAGDGSLAVTCTRYARGRTQWYSNDFTVEEGKAYKISFYARAVGDASRLSVHLRMIPGPWTSHFGEEFSLLPQWQRFDMIGLGIKTEHMDKTAIFFSFNGIGTVWIDDVTMEQIDLPAVEPRDTGNLLRNSSFEVDASIDEWVSCVRRPDLIWHIDTEQAAHGNRSLRGRGPLFSNYYKLRPNTPHTLSLYLRGDKPSQVTVGLWGRKAIPIFERKVDVTPEWRRYTLSGNSKIVIGNNYFVKIDAPEMVWVDGVQLEEGSHAGAYQPAREATVEASAIVAVDEDKSRVFYAGQSVQVRLRLVDYSWLSDDSGRQTFPLPFTWRLMDSYGDTEQEGSGQATADNPETMITVTPERLGMYRLVVRPEGGKGHEDVFAVVHPRVAEPDPDSPMGAHFMLQPVMLDMVKKIGIGRQRCHWPPVATQWHVCEPEKGKFVSPQWYTDLAAKNGISLLGSLAWTPAWAKADKKYRLYTTEYPTDLEDWRNYVRWIVKNCPDIREWEVTNEPDLDVFYKGTDEHLMELLIAAAEEIKKIDPTLKVIAFGNALVKTFISTHLPLLKKHDALKHLSAVSVHLYHSPLAIDRLEEQVGSAGEIRAFLDDAGYPEIEIWDTESGGSGRGPETFRRAWSWGQDALSFGSPTKSTENTEEMRGLDAAGDYIKMTAATLGMGVRRIYTYVLSSSCGPERAFEYALLDPDRGPRPVITAISTITRFLESAKPLGKIQVNDPHLQGYQFQKDEDTGIVFIWSREENYNKSVDLSGLKSLNIHDAFGNGIDLSSGKTTIDSRPAICIMDKDSVPDFLRRL
ncbi:MAG: carbohydrate binding domain-containing protein [Victivallales bacterium]|nr:carbohydrate binding domain-containing protein [Victivallales bacterium]